MVIDMNKNKRLENIMPKDQPKYVRVYDNGGDSFDRYTVVFTGRYRKKNDEFGYRVMSENPFDAHGIGIWDSSPNQIDVNKWGFAPAMGRKNHLGKRILFATLPDQCRRLVISDYKELWSLN